MKRKRREEILRIGLDIDGVVSDSYSVWVEEINRYFGTNIKELKNSCDMHLDFGVTWEEMEKYFVENIAHLLTIPEPIKGAKEGIEKLLSLGHEIIYVTARTPGDKDYTLRWMAKHGIPQVEIYFAGYTSKAEYALERKIELFVEDDFNNAIAIAKAGIPVLLMDASYNQGEMPAKVIRCQDWNQILKEVENIDCALRKLA